MSGLITRIIQMELKLTKTYTLAQVHACTEIPNIRLANHSLHSIQWTYTSSRAIRLYFSTCMYLCKGVGFSQLQFHLNSYPHLHSPHLCLYVFITTCTTLDLQCNYVHRPILVPWTYIGLSWTYMYMYLHRPTLDLHVPI